MSQRRVAVVLFNLGGPDGPDAVLPFLFNLFRDPAIITAPAVVRYPLAALISTTRTKLAKANYALMGGGSPLLPETEKQARALEAAMAVRVPDAETRCFIAMRYWKPFARETARAVAAFAPDEIVLLPLYPQYSSTTTGSSLKDWKSVYRGPGETTTICCYPTSPGLIEAHAQLIQAAYDQAGRPGPARLLFSAHGLPEKIIEAGDPYQAQIEATAAAVVERLGPGWDWRISYQSRVGRLKWIGPSTDDEIRAAGAEGKALVVTPIAFVSEHVETLVELDHEYGDLARQVGCPAYVRVPALGVTPSFIDDLAGSVTRALERSGTVTSACGWRCGDRHTQCPRVRNSKERPVA
jgi:protoporphyrin/coproporphyrin ferrochelatase